MSRFLAHNVQGRLRLLRIEFLFHFIHSFILFHRTQAVTNNTTTRKIGLHVLKVFRRTERPVALTTAYCTDAHAQNTHKTQINKKAQLSLTNPRDAKACQKLIQFDVLTTLSLTILAYLHSFSCCCVRNLRNPAKFTENSSLWSSKSSKVIDLSVNRKPICDLLLVINSNFSRICCRFRDIHG